MYWGRWGIGYHAAHLRRYAASGDPVVQAPASVNLLFCWFQAVALYFTMRRLPWCGEKAATPDLLDHDPDSFSLLRSCPAEPNMMRMVDRYEELTRRDLRS